MQTMSPLMLYRQALKYEEYQPDKVQYAAILCLEDIYQTLSYTGTQELAISSGLFGKLNKLKLWRKRKSVVQKPTRGLYIWGGVGRGKTWLMDIFFQSIPYKRKLRLHFHRFMLRVHQELNELQGHSDPLLIVADRFKAEIDLLCFDEFFVSDITDAMLLGTLIEALFSCGVTLIATSNIPPDELYRNGLQRTRFMSVIELIKKYCEIINVDAGIDYRLQSRASTDLWMTPLGKVTSQEMNRMFITLAGRPCGDSTFLEINHRQLPTLGMVEGVLAMSFTVLCGEGRSQCDYIELSRRFHSILLYDVPVMIYKTEDQARRFVALVDEFYDRNVKLVVSAEASFYKIYQGSQIKFEFQRCVSRLQEMQSKEYLARFHLP